LLESNLELSVEKNKAVSPGIEKELRFRLHDCFESFVMTNFKLSHLFFSNSRETLYRNSEFGIVPMFVDIGCALKKSKQNIRINSAVVIIFFIKNVSVTGRHPSQ